MKTALVTGACTNTGAAIVKRFLREGYTVVFTGRSAKKVKAAQAEYEKEFRGAKIFGYPLSSLLDERTVDEKAVLDLFSELDGKGLFVDTLVLNAADQGLGQKIFQTPLADFQKVISCNVIWNYCIAQAAAARMRAQGGGCIIFINSNTAYRAIPDRIAYCASKGAQLGMMHALALDLGKFGIRVNAVLPGMIKTDRWEKDPEFYRSVPSRYTPIGDVAVGSDIADAVWYFTALARNTTGAELVVDGGNTIQLYPIIPKDGKDARI